MPRMILDPVIELTIKVSHDTRLHVKAFILPVNMIKAMALCQVQFFLMSTKKV